MRDKVWIRMRDRVQIRVIHIYMRRFGEYTPKRHNISVALGPHGTPK